MNLIAITALIYMMRDISALPSQPIRLPFHVQGYDQKKKRRKSVYDRICKKA